MLPNAATFVRGMKDTADVIAQDKPYEISNKVWVMDPNRNKLLAWAQANHGSEVSPQSVFGHFEETAFPNWVTFNGVDESSQQTTGDGDTGALVFATGTNQLVQLGSRIFFPRTGEIIWLTADMTSSTVMSTVVRNFGRGTAACLLQTGDKGFILPPAHIEGFTVEEGLSGYGAYKYFYMTQTSYPVEVTDVEDNEFHLTGNPFNRALKKSWKQAADQQEGELIFSGSKLDTTSYAHPVRATQGFDNFITTNVFSANKLTRQDLWDLLAIWEGLNHDGGVIVCSRVVKYLINEWALERSTIPIQITGQKGEGQFGTSIDAVKTPGNTYPIIDVDLLGQEPYMAGTMFFIPNNRMKRRFLNNMDTAYRPITQDEKHKRMGEITGMVGWQFFEEEMWMKLSGLNVAA